MISRKKNNYANNIRTLCLWSFFIFVQFLLTCLANYISLEQNRQTFATAFGICSINIPRRLKRKKQHKLLIMYI